MDYNIPRSGCLSKTGHRVNSNMKREWRKLSDWRRLSDHKNRFWGKFVYM